MGQACRERQGTYRPRPLTDKFAKLDAVKAIQLVFDLDRHINSFLFRGTAHILSCGASPEVDEVGPERCPGRCGLAEHHRQSLLVVVEPDAVVDSRESPATTEVGCSV